MRKRYLYSLLFGIPGIFAAGIVSIFTMGAFAGILWLFVFGDNPWPASAQTILATSFVLVFLMLWIGIGILGYWVGRRLEKDPELNRNHLLISAGLTVVFLLLMAVYQWRIGAVGAGSDNAVCSEFCTQHGFSASGLPPANSGSQICSCYDDAGNEAIRIPLDHLAPNTP